MTRTHVLGPAQTHYNWSRANRPAIEVDPGDEVVCDTQEVSGGQVTPGCPAEVLMRMDPEKIYPLAGPVFVKGARPGDALEIQILDLRTAPPSSTCYPSPPTSASRPSSTPGTMKPAATCSSPPSGGR